MNWTEGTFNNTLVLKLRLVAVPFEIQSLIRQKLTEYLTMFE